MKKFILCFVFALVFIGCSGETKIIHKCQIAPALLEVPKFETKRQLLTQQDYAFLMLDIYGAYERCALNLQSIKRLNDE